MAGIIRRCRIGQPACTSHPVPLTSSALDDFTLLHAGNRAPSERSRPMVLWIMGLAVLVVAAVVALVWYLNNFETKEEERRRGADAQWLDQSVQFHFRRLEYDLAQNAREAALGANVKHHRTGQEDATDDDVPAGMLWRAPGVVLAHAWLATHGQSSGDVMAWQEDQARNPANFQALQTLQDIASGLRRASYAGPMRRADGSATDLVWLAVPYFDGSRLVGLDVAQISMQRAVDVLLPTWFLENQTVRLVVDAVQPDPVPQPQGPYRTVMNLPGTDLMLEVVPQGPQTSPVPRIFFVVALLFLLGMLASLVALRRDIAKRQQVQQRLRAEVALRTAMERAVTIGMRAWDMQGKILYVNEAFCSMVGYSADELRNASAPLPYWPADQVSEIALLHQHVLHQGIQGLEMQYLHRDGHLVDVFIHEAPLTAANGQQLGWMSSVLDISERKKAQQLAALQQEKLEASGRLVAVGEVASTLAHELNQPLGALASFTNGLLNRLRGGSITPAEMEPVVQRMAQLAERAGGVIQRVNAFARRRELRLTHVDLSALVRRAALAAQDNHGTPLSLELPASPIWVQGDALLLEHLVHNLCSNALDWAARGTARPLVQVRLHACAQSDTSVTLAVADNGPGVPESARARIFDAFFSTKSDGMGMGLAICRSIAEAHHGRITVAHDDALGGALFTVTLPLDAPHPPPTAQP